MHETASTKNSEPQHPGSGPEELTGLTEHLRRHTVQQGDVLLKITKTSSNCIIQRLKSVKTKSF